MNLSKYIQETNEASVRCRKVIFILITASIVFFIGYWNARPGSWEHRRLAVAKDALKWLSLQPTNNSKLIPFSTTNIFMEDWLKADVTQHFMRLSGLETPEDLKTLATLLQHKHDEQGHFITIPIFGVTFSNNDLGILGGFTFVVILIMLRMSHARMLKNLELTFQKIPNENKEIRKDVYHLLSMSQVLTIPPEKGKPTPYLWIILAKSFYLLPLLVQTTIACIDVKTWEKGVLLSDVNTGMTLFGNFLFLGFIAVLTYACLALSVSYDRVWRNQFKIAFPD